MSASGAHASRTGRPHHAHGRAAGDIAAFLRALNALENIRQGEDYVRTALARGPDQGAASLRLAREEIEDAMEVLTAVGLHGDAVEDLRQAIRSAAPAHDRWRRDLELALGALQRARSRILSAPSAPATSTP